VLELLPPYNRAEAVRGLEGFSHIWVSFVLALFANHVVKPPRQAP